MNKYMLAGLVIGAVAGAIIGSGWGLASGGAGYNAWLLFGAFGAVVGGVAGNWLGKKLNGS